MFTSAIESKHSSRKGGFFADRMRKSAAVYCGVTLFVLIFGVVYTHFGHGVTSRYMTWAFAVPGIFGFLPCVLCAAARKIPRPGRLCFNLMNAGVATATLFSLTRGAFEIADTWTYFPLYMIALGAAQWLCAVLLWIIFPKLRAA